MKVVGIDSCKGGWFYIALTENGDHEVGVEPYIFNLCEKHNDALLLLIDIPIGLPSNQPRQCDISAREMLSPNRSSSVFPVPCRQAVYAGSYEEACNLNFLHLGTRLSRQSWSICCRISQVDSFLTNPQHVPPLLRESHPEVCFWAMNGHYPLKNSKKSREGLIERLAILQNIFSHSASIYNDAVNGYLRKELARDDILDALVLAVTALLSHNQLNSVAPVEFDEKGLPMEIVYFG